ncbi:unnamed protein product [Rhizoctonia solani]|uniref:Uncharacterized protein n=1 Tax=Rhizoctonia solani TaxID=456999 RepID=A0A8H3DXR0_9AGAM|nr:unnamed protein product [Rhizoctonia solani]
MHLLFENLVPNMIKHWIGDFKGLNAGNGTYQIPKPSWLIVGLLTALATRTIPSVFVGTLPDIALDRVLYKAEAYAFWIQYLAPILLKNLLAKKYYEHLVQLREIILLCLQFKITNEEIDELQTMINTWVIKYEEYYYQYRATRLPTCPLTLHALLHIPYYIRKTGPLWASWAFVMERFCGHLLPAVKNRIRPYEHLDHYVERRAQMQIVSKVYNMPSLAKPRIKYKYVGDVQMSSHEVAYKEFSNVVLGRPVKRVELDKTLGDHMVRYFSIVYPGRSVRQLHSDIAQDTLVRYGRFRIVDDGDSFRTAILIDRDPLARDNSYVKYDLLPDRNTRFRNRLDDPMREVQYGRLLDIYYVEFMESQEKRIPYLLARVEECDTGGRDAARRGTPLVTYKRVFAPILVHIDTIYAVVGRVSLGRNEWAMLDRSRDGVRTQFLDEAGNVDRNLE